MKLERANIFFITAKPAFTALVPDCHYSQSSASFFQPPFLSTRHGRCIFAYLAYAIIVPDKQVHSQLRYRCATPECKWLICKTTHLSATL